MKNIDTELQASVDQFWNVMNERFQGRVMTGRAVITQVTRDGAGRVSGAMATVDGALAQRVVFDYGAPVALGDTYMAANDGGVSNPMWRLVRRLQTTSATPPLDTVPTLPTPTGLTLTKGLYAPDLGQEVKAWISAHWLTLPHRYGKLAYEVECVLTSDISADAIIARVLDSWPTSTLAEDISSTETTIPHTSAPHVAYNKFSLGRIQIRQEKIDYTAVTSDCLGPQVIGTGIGSANSFYDSSASWDDDAWKNFALIDSADGIFRITANDSNTLTVIGTPASGSYYIYTAFCDCTRGAGGTEAMAYDAMQDLVGRSCGLLFAGLRANTDYSLRVRATNEAGAISAWSARVSITTDPDLTIPPTPTGFTVESADAGVVLRWTAPTINTTPDLAGFFVYRAPNSSPDPGDITKIKEVGLRNETFVEAALATELYYALTAYDSSMNESPKTSWETALAHPAVIVNPGALLFTRTAELSAELAISEQGIQSNSPPVPSYTPSSTEISLGAAITFNNTSVGATAYLWDFGDGETSAETSPVYTFATAGVFRVRLTCYSDWGEQYIVGKTPITVNAGAPPGRITAGLQYLALFNEGAGLVVHDQSGVGLAYNTTITGDVTWGSESLTINDDTVIKGATFSKVIDACMATDEITIEAWVKPSTETGGRILANTDRELYQGNFVLAQIDNQYDVRLRTTLTNLRGMPSLGAVGAPDTTAMQQVTYTRDSSGNAKLYVDAVEVASMTIGGDFSTWENFRFAMGNDVGENEPWLGEMELVAIYDAALSQAEIETNLMAGGGTPGPPPGAPTADFTFDVTTGKAPLVVHITNLSTGNPTQWRWEYDDGRIAGGEDPGAHIYYTPGVYSPSLTVSNEGGSHTKTRDGYVTVTDDGSPPAGDHYYVSNSGNDGTGDGSKLNPWYSVQKGVDEIRRGDTLVLRGGTYHEKVVFNNMQGESGAWYRIKNESGETPIIDGRYALPSGGNFVSTCNGKGFVYAGLVQFNGINKYIKFEGIRIQGSRGTGVRTHKTGSGRNLTFSNCRIQSCRGATINTRDYDNILLEDCIVSDSMNYCKVPRAARQGQNWAGSVTINRGSGHIIRGVLLYDCYGEGIHPFTWGSGVVEDCVIFNCMCGMMPITCCQNVTVQRNFVYSTRVSPFYEADLLNFTMEAGASAESGGATQTNRKQKSFNCEFINNIAVDGEMCNRQMDRLSMSEQDYRWGFYKNSLFAHNTLVHHTDRFTEYVVKWLPMYHVSDIATMEFCNNIFWSYGASNLMFKKVQGSPRYRYNCWSQKPTRNSGGDYTAAMGAGDFYENPRLVNANAPLSGDGTRGYTWLRNQALQYKLTDRSPVLGEGRDAGVADDFWGNARGSSPDMGAHER